MNILIAFLCLLVAALIAAGAALFAYKVGYIKRDAEQVRSEFNALHEEYKQTLAHVQQLEFAIDTEQKERARNQQKPNGWNPSDLMNGGERQYT